MLDTVDTLTKSINKLASKLKALAERKALEGLDLELAAKKAITESQRASRIHAKLVDLVA